MGLSIKESLRIGWNSVKANRVTMLVLWALAASLAVAYYRLPVFAELLAPVKDWQARNGAVAAFATQFFFCGVLPAVFLSVVSEIKTEHHLMKCVLEDAGTDPAARALCGGAEWGGRIRVVMTFPK